MKCSKGHAITPIDLSQSGSTLLAGSVVPPSYMAVKCECLLKRGKGRMEARAATNQVHYVTYYSFLVLALFDLGEKIGFAGWQNTAALATDLITHPGQKVFLLINLCFYSSALFKLKLNPYLYQVFKGSKKRSTNVKMRLACTRFSSWQHYWHWVPDNLLWGNALCIVVYLVACLSLPLDASSSPLLNCDNKIFLYHCQIVRVKGSKITSS